ncbi:hypothetical protein GOBAR_DD32981 [Gossypium barbadense]|nr:hypothetical protein GOBAR_DD32981 [Gossypium barbadense]
MDLTFMETVWWVFAQLYKKGLVYKGFKVMPYSTWCKTPLSNFEAGINHCSTTSWSSEAAFRVIADNYATDDNGTGIVHCAPAFGEDDYRECIENQIINKGENLIVAVDDDGCLSGKITGFNGRYVKDADKDIIEAL